MILEKKFAQYLLQQMGLGALSPEEEGEYIQDAMGELLNIILGHTTNELLERNIAINIEIIDITTKSSTRVNPSLHLNFITRL